MAAYTSSTWTWWASSTTGTVRDAGFWAFFWAFCWADFLALRALLVACERSAPGVTFCLFSAQGAGSVGGGMSFALKIKGEAESKLFASDLERKFAFRPGYIAPSGPRNTWKKGDYLLKPLQRLMPSIGVTSDELAHAMLQTAMHDPRRTAVLENGEMRTLLG